MDASLYHDFARLEQEHWWFAARRHIVAQTLRRLLPARPDRPDRSDRKILDLGCGTGGMLIMLTEFGRVCGMDLSEDAIRYCREALPRERQGDVDLRVGDISVAPPSGAEWDTITAFDVIEHLDDDAGILRQVHASLADDGLFVCTVPAFQFLWGPHDDLNHHRRRYSAVLLRQRLHEAGFKPLYLSYFNFWLFPLVAAVRVGRRLLPFKEKVPKSDITMPSGLVNRILTAIFTSEAAVLRFTSVPVGVSLLAVCVKQSAGSAGK